VKNRGKVVQVHVVEEGKLRPEGVEEFGATSEATSKTGVSLKNDHIH